MLAVENKLFDEYKAVDNICRDIFQNQNGVAQYIEEMDRNFYRGSSSLPSWNEDYRRLKRVRWMRNTIAHETSTTECSEEDIAWLKEFHSRLLIQQDPLALLRTADRKRMSSPQRIESTPNINFEQRTDKNVNFKPVNQGSANYLQQREITSNFSAERRTNENVNLQKRKKSSLQKAVTAIIIFIEVIIILTDAAILFSAVVMNF